MQFEHTQNAYYWSAIGKVRSVLSTQNVDSQMLAERVRGAHGREQIRLIKDALAMRASERRAARRADIVLAVSEHDQRHFERYSRHVLMAPNGVDDEFFDIPTGLPDNNDVLFFGLFYYAPNEEGVARYLKRGWPHLAASNQRARLLLAGKGMSESLARQVDGHERVVRLGFVPDLPDLLRRCRVVLVPVWHGGGTRLKVLEALASARPIVGTGKAVEGIGRKADSTRCSQKNRWSLRTPLRACWKMPRCRPNSRRRGESWLSVFAGIASWPALSPSTGPGSPGNRRPRRTWVSLVSFSSVSPRHRVAALGRRFAV